MQRTWASVGLAIMLAACLTPQTKDSTAAAIQTVADALDGLVAKDLMEDFVDPMVQHSLEEHRDPKLHQFAWHMEELFHHPLGGDALTASGAHAVEIQNGYLFVAAYGATVDIDGGVYVFDLKDPEHPEFHSQYRMVGNVGGDRSMEVTDDADWIVVGTEANDCGGSTNPFGPGIYLLDFQNKEAAPTLADYLPLPGGIHSVTIHRVAGEDYVYALGAFQGNNIYHIDTSLPKARLVPVGQVQIRHDAAAYDDPVLGIPILYVANQNDLSVYDITDPAKPRQLGKWAPTRDELNLSYVHSVAMEMIEGHRILVLESENWQQIPSPVWMLDATDFSAIERIGNWTNPGQAPANSNINGSTYPRLQFTGQLIFSTHNPRLENGIVWMSHYHGGVWALDVSTFEKASHPQAVGYYLPHEDNGGYRPGSNEGAYPKPNVACGFELNQMPNVMDAEVQDGIAYMADVNTGLYVVTLDDLAKAHISPV